jgi:DnaJ-class molecular chaperone
MDNVEIICESCLGSGQAVTFNGDAGVDACSACDGKGYFLE